MEVYQPLNWIFNVSKKCSKAVKPVVLEKLLKKALTDYHSGETGVVTKNGVSVSVVGEASGLLYIKMEEIRMKNDKDTHRTDVLLPMKASIVKLKAGTPTEKVQVNDLPLKLTWDHLFSDWFEPSSDHHEVVTAVPVLEEIFKSEDITGEKVYDYAVKTIYRTHKELILRKPLVQSALTDNSIALVKKLSDDQWEMTCFNRLVPPEGSWRHLSVTFPWVACGFRLSKDTQKFMLNH